MYRCNVNPFTAEFHKVDFSVFENWTTSLFFQQEIWLDLMSRWQTMQILEETARHELSLLDLHYLRKPFIAFVSERFNTEMQSPFVIVLI